MSDEPLSQEEIEADLEQFELEGAEYLGPSEFARLMNMKPQLVHYYIRAKVLEAEMCKCGRKVIDVERGRKALSEHKATKETNVRRAPDDESSQ